MYGDASKTPFLFNGMYGVMTDANNLYYMRARFYSPEIKRFVNQDILLGSIGDGQMLNRYAFVTGQPISLIDPEGKVPVIVVFAFALFLTQLEGDIPIKLQNTQNTYVCFGKIRNYHHNYLCHNNECAGLMPSGNKGYFPIPFTEYDINSGYVKKEIFNEEHCAIDTIDKKCNVDIYESCIKDYVNSSDSKYYNIFLYNCISEVFYIRGTCKAKACR
jgi:RHS repeat-associated protein